MSRLLSFADCTAILGQGTTDEVASWLTSAMRGYYNANANYQGEGRQNGLAPFRLQFSGAQGPIDWLMRLWESTRALPTLVSDTHTSPFLAVLKKMVLGVPIIDANETLLQPADQYITRTLIDFIRSARCHELLPTLAMRFFARKGGWYQDEDLFYATLDACVSVSGHSQTTEFAALLLKEPILNAHALTPEHLAVVWVTMLSGYEELADLTKLYKDSSDLENWLAEQDQNRRVKNNFDWKWTESVQETGMNAVVSNFLEILQAKLPKISKMAMMSMSPDDDGLRTADLLARFNQPNSSAKTIVSQSGVQ